uniref:tryptophan synthase subunit alpha n=1 Tax=Streptomyces phytophilus TaxID=722715 RepID=UPI0015EFE275
ACRTEPGCHLTRGPRPRSPDTPFFPGRTPRDPGLALFLNAGDPGLEHTRDLLLLFDGLGVDCVELAVPFPDSVTDGPVIRASARRALAAGTDAYWDAAEQTGQRVITTCYADSAGAVLARAARRSTAYVYLVAAYGRSGTAPPPDPARLRPAALALHRTGAAPVAVGFGVRTRHDVRDIEQFVTGLRPAAGRRSDERSTAKGADT